MPDGEDEEKEREAPLAEGLTFFAEVEADSGQAMMWRSHSGERRD